MGPDVFRALTPVLPHIHTLTLTGIGEPLMYAGFDTCISAAREVMPENSVRGFQTNGKLLTRERALSLVDAGLNKICISVDASDPFLFSSLRSGGSLADINAAFDALDFAKEQIPDSGLSTGIEFVLMKKNLDQLPNVVEWAGQKGVDFILVTHVTAYDYSTEKEQAFMDNSREGLALFADYSLKAAQMGVDIGQYKSVRWKFHKSPADMKIYNLVKEMKQEALNKGIYVNLFHLLAEDPQYYERIQTLFDRARLSAERHNMSLTLPDIRPKTSRYCPFVEKKAMFVTWEGEVCPCYFLWHGYQTMRLGYTKTVNPHRFGNVLEKDPNSIWNSPDYIKFRANVKKYDYPNCHSWCETRCDYVLDAPFYQDCFINEIPCCDCHWNLGFLNCLN